MKRNCVTGAPQAKILRFFAHFLGFFSAPPQNGGEHRGEQFSENSSAPPQNGGDTGGSILGDGGESGGSTPPHPLEANIEP